MENLDSQIDKECDLNWEGLLESQNGDYVSEKHQMSKISSLTDDRQKPLLNVSNSGFNASYGIDYHQYSLPCSFEKHWEKILDHLKSIEARKAGLKEILIAIGYFIKEFGTIQNEVEESKKQGADDPAAPNLFLLVNYLLQLTKEEKKECIEGIIPFIARLVLRTNEIFKTTTSPPQITILSQGIYDEVKLTKEQCACLMAHMFFCITLDHNKKNDNMKKLACLRNFSALYTDSIPIFCIRQNIKTEKLKFIFNYFRRVWKNMPEKEVVFTRLSYNKDTYNEISEQEWKKCEDPLKKASVEKSSIPLEKEKCGVQISFSDKRIGNDTLKIGSTQHQIMLLNHPEILVAILFCESLEDKEALMVKGAERFSTSVGFKSKLKFEKNYADACDLVDCANILDKDFVMIDALNFHSWRSSKLSEDGKIQKAGETQFHQFSLEAILREINKAYIGFLGNILQDKSLGDLLYNGKHEKIGKAILTGRWGCGTYLGNAQLKFIIQWIAASRAQKEMNFFLYDMDIDEFKNVDEFINCFQNQTIGKLLRGLLSYCKDCEKKNEFPTKKKDLFQEIIQCEKITSFSMNNDTIDG